MRKRLIAITMVLLLTLAIGSITLACSTQPTPTVPKPPPTQPPAPPPPPQPQPLPAPPAPASLTKVQFLAQACFLITSSTGLKVITDPYATSDRLTYSPITETADIVTVSHEHSDHNNVAAVQGQPEVVKGIGVKNVKGIAFKGITSYHDESSGKQRGANTIFCFSVDGIRFCHLGDLGHQLDSVQIAEIGQVDVLLIPVGGFYTVDAKAATEICNELKPRIAIPMHYKTPKTAGLTLAGVEDFLQGKDKVKKLVGSVFEFKPAELPKATEIIVLEMAK